MDDRHREMYLAWLSGDDVVEIARRHGLSRSQTHRILKRVTEQEPVQARAGVDAKAVTGPFTSAELTRAIRTYAERRGVMWRD